MSEDTETFKRKSIAVDKIVERVILGMSVVLLAWTANMVVRLKEDVSAHSTMLQLNSGRLMLAEGTAGDIKAIQARLDSIRDAQLRIEARLEEHMRLKK